MAVPGISTVSFVHPVNPASPLPRFHAGRFAAQ